ncbi:MAG: hypothetical protein O3B09_03760 [Proteobacteria bacterium]|nr:hypothetical protein [Pseudomonadota bacterium]
MLLERRNAFQMFGGMRLGSAFDCKDLFDDYGFDHVALCLGAGRPNIIDIKNNFAKGIRCASDFLMALQLTGAARKDLLTNLQVRLPVVVVGAGLTATDTACEALAYYVVQVEKFLSRYEILCQNLGKDSVESTWNEEDRQIAEEFIQHGQAIRKAQKNGENIAQLLKSWGGSVIAYRKKMTDSPAYRLNDHELYKAFEEGIEFIEEVNPTEAVIDQFNHIKSLKLDQHGEQKEIPAKSLFFAAGTSPNKAPAYEGKMPFTLDKNTFQIIDFDGNKLEAIASPKAQNIGFLAAKDEESNKTVSFFGDLHPSFSGSVVKAMASAKNGYPIINQALSQLDQQHYPKEQNYQKFLSDLSQKFSVRVKEVNILSDYVFELIIHAPALAKQTKLGHIFRLHNYHHLAQRKKCPLLKTPVNQLLQRNFSSPSFEQHSVYDNTRAAQKDEERQNSKQKDDSQGSLLAMEGVAVTTYKVDQTQGLIGVMVINTGGSSSLVRNLKAGEPIIFMGPSGTPNHIDKDKTVMLIGAGRGVFPTASLAKEYKKQGCKVIFFCGYKQNAHILRREELEDACDALIIAVEEKPAITTNRASDQLFHGDVIEAIIAYGKGALGKQQVSYQEIDLIFTMGNEHMMHKVSKLHHDDLKGILNPDHISITNLSNPMQCMMKGICSQCLQKKTREKTGKVEYFYSCINQDQKANEIDFNFLKNRCAQNSLQEKLTRLWITNL